MHTCARTDTHTHTHTHTHSDYSNNAIYQTQVVKNTQIITYVCR